MAKAWYDDRPDPHSGAWRAGAAAPPQTYSGFATASGGDDATRHAGGIALALGGAFGRPVDGR